LVVKNDEDEMEEKNGGEEKQWNWLMNGGMERGN
jgi:hypothetical protein